MIKSFKLKISTDVLIILCKISWEQKDMKVNGNENHQPAEGWIQIHTEKSK